MGNVLIFAEHQDGKLKKTSLELASKAAELAGKIGGEADAVLIGSGLDAIANELAPYGIKKVVVLQSPKLDKYNTLGYVNALAGVVKELNPDIFLATASPAGRDFFPRLAARLDTGLASDVVDLKIDGDGKMLATHPIYSGKALVDIKIPNSKPQMALIRPNSFG